MSVVFWNHEHLKLNHLGGQVDLIYHRMKDVFYLNVVVNVPETTPYDPEGILGIDLGIINLAVDSTE